VRALALAKRSRLLVQSEVEEIDKAEAWALEAVSAAQLVGAGVEDRVRTALVWARILRGRSIDDLIPPEPVARPPWNGPESSIDRPLAARLTFRGQLEEARAILRPMLALADEWGDL
jgi:hypothetical protein